MYSTWPLPENYGLTQLVDKSACTYERYKLTNVVNGKYYFGQTIDLKTRLGDTKAKPKNRKRT